MAKFARTLGMSPQQLNDLLNGRRIPGNSTQSRLRELGCNIEWLMTGKELSVKEELRQFVKEHPGSYIPDDLPEKTRKRIKQLIEEVKDLDESEIDRVREIIRMIFGTTRKRRR